MTEANILMPRLFDIGMHSGDPLHGLQHKLANVNLEIIHKQPATTTISQTKNFISHSRKSVNIKHAFPKVSRTFSSQMHIPLLTAHQMEAAGREAGEDGSAKSREQVTSRDELLHRTYKFLGVTNTTLQQLQILGLFYIIMRLEPIHLNVRYLSVFHYWKKKQNT